MIITWLAGKIASPLLQGVIGLLVPILLLGGGYFAVKYAWNHWYTIPKLEKEIRDLQDLSIKYQAQVYRLETEKQDQKVVIKYREKKSHDTAKVDAAAAAGDDAGMDNIFIGLGMLPPRPAGSAKDRERSPGH